MVLPKTLLIFLYSTILIEISNQSKTQRYLDLISQTVKQAEQYQWPKSAIEYEAINKTRTYYGSYDFVIVGGGTSGTVIANRLSENPNWKILLLEAGKEASNVTEIPGLIPYLHLSDYNWAFNSTKQKTACLGMKQQICPIPRGKGLGGSTLINCLTFNRAYKKDYERWSQIANHTRWGYDTVIKYFQKMEKCVSLNHSTVFDLNQRGTNGTFQIEYPKTSNPQVEAFFSANNELGFNVVDYNTNKIGINLPQFITNNGQRIDNNKAYLKPIKSRTNLKILTGAFATRISLKNGVASGVEFSTKRQNFYVEASKEVVLSAGVFGTAQLLLLSGVGPKKHLESMEVPLIADLPVGTTLLDHPAFYGLFISTNYTEPTKSLHNYVTEYLEGTGLLTVPYHAHALGYYESSYKKGSGVPDLELIFIPSNSTIPIEKTILNFEEDFFQNIDPSKNVRILLIALDGRSVGSFKLKNKNPYEYPLINPKFLSDGHDINVLYEGIELVERLLQTEAFRKIDARINLPKLEACRDYQQFSKDFWYCALRQLSGDLYHAVGTAAMGQVVGSDLLVYGFRNLRVADGSVIPFTLAAHPVGPTIMIGEQLGDLLLDKYKVGN